MTTDRTQANKQDHRIIDRIAEIALTQDGFEFLLSETNDMFMNGMMFAIGAFATLGYEPVAEGLREIIKKPKGKKK